MVKAQLLFSSFENSFSVHIENLEALSIEQIKELQRFVDVRRGVFDFNTYSFVIQKRLSFEEFKTLIEKSSINAVCKESLHQTDHHRPRVGFGQYKGLLYSDLPDSYMMWLKSNYNGKDRAIIEEELKTRGL